MNLYSNIIKFFTQITATEYIYLNKKINHTIILPYHYLNSLDQSNFINRIIIELFIHHILLFIIIIFLLHYIISPLFNTTKLKDSINIFLITIIPTIYSYMNEDTPWNKYIISNIISAIIGYFVVIIFSKYFNYFILQIIIIIFCVIIMVFFNLLDINSIIYGLIAYSLVPKIGLDYISKWVIYVILSFIIVLIVLYINNRIIQNYNSKYTTNAKDNN
jgi:hypothetical protein